MRRTWIKDSSWDDGTPAFGPRAGDDSHADAVTLVWRLIKAGYRADIIRPEAELPPEKAGKVFALLAAFDDAKLRHAAAAYFELPDLPAMIKLAFKLRFTLDDHLTLATFGAAHSAMVRGTCRRDASLCAASVLFPCRELSPARA